jgi:hypothetical protein
VRSASAIGTADGITAQATLGRWITRAATCTTAAAVFAATQRKARRRAESAAR